MPGFPDESFPQRPFFSCEEGQFLIVDQAQLGAAFKHGAEPWLSLTVGPDNVMASRPMKVTRHSGMEIDIECRDAVIKLNLSDESARKVSLDGQEFVYCGGLEEANHGLGWIPVS